MADVDIIYRGNTIAQMSASGTKTLLTAGKICRGNITVNYTSPGGGGTPTNLITNGDFSVPGATTTGWSAAHPTRTSLAVSGGKLVFTVTNKSNVTYALQYACSIQAGHTYLCRYKYTKTLGDSDADGKIVRIMLGSEEMQRRTGLVQNDVVEDACAITAASAETLFKIQFGGNIASSAVNNGDSMLEVFYVELWDITDIISGW